MFTRRLQLSFFLAAFQHHYRSRLITMVSPFITKQILEVLVCLKNDKLINGFTIFKQAKRPAFRSVLVHFCYINNNALLFYHIRSILPRIYLTSAKLQQWIRQKTSLAFPVLLIETSTHGIVTDRQLVYLQLNNKLTSYLGGRLIAKIDNF